jgi:hypothetical protein
MMYGKFNMDKKAMSPKAKGKSEAKVSGTTKSPKKVKEKLGKAMKMMEMIRMKKK